MNFKDAKILITGGSGFLGKHINEKIKKDGAKTENFDMTTGCDITNYEKVDRCVKKKFDFIFHLAGYSGTLISNQNREKFLQINSLATVNLFSSVIKFSPQTKIIFSSSRQEYGKPKYLPVDEKHPTNPISMYGLTKLIATQIAQLNRSKLMFTILRTSNVYGQTSKTTSDYNILNRFINLAKKNKVIKIFGKGNQIRDYLYIDDFVSAFILCTEQRATGQIYNLGFGKGIKINEMAKLIVKTFGKGSIKYIKWPQEYKEVETGSYVSDIEKIKRELGFIPKITFKEGISNLAE